jgi:asparagine synthase (glutamine-hydrolysing)
MCGIAGFNWKDEERVEEMTRLLEHRGPDQWGTYCQEGISLGHRRLSILDLSDRGRQPMGADRGRTWIVFNGEIYNYREVRARLEGRGYLFQSRTDTEVILHAYHEYGQKCLEQFNGMFAFCIWDARDRSLFIARDRLGVKPLYYYHDGAGCLVFASEIKSLLKNPAVPCEIDLQSLYYFVGYEFIPAPMTIFKGIRKLPAGHYLLFKEGKLEIVRYWDIDFKERARPRQEVEMELVERLEGSVRKRLESDVPLGVFLSGGIDSSSVVAMMSRILGKDLSTFSLGYREADFSEFSYARKVADHFGTRHTELLIDPVSQGDIERAIWHLDEPFSEFSILPYYLICRKAKEHISVCLSGEGGDELFAGYDRFKASKIDRLFRRIPSFLRKAITQGATWVPDSPKKKGILNSGKRLLEGAELPRSGSHMRWQYFLNPADEASLFSDDLLSQIDRDPFTPILDTLRGTSATKELDRELYVELRFMMPENPLMKVDKMSMAHALEVRAPFLDYEFVEFSATIPAEWKLEGWTSKSILKSAMKDILPEGIAYRRKHGYSFPIKHWLRQELKDYMQAVLTDSPLIKSCFKMGFVQQRVREHLSGFSNHSHLLWALMNLAIWHRLFMEDPNRQIRSGRR